MRKIALITGATSGLGRAIALRLAKEGYDVIITGRRKDRLEELEREIEIKYESKVYSLCFDVRVYNEVEKAITSLPEEWKAIDILVNNAGLAVGLDPIQQGVIDDWERMIDTNIKGLLYVTRVVSPGMVSRKSGHIVNLGSIAGKGVYPNGAVYCATKHAVDALSQGMRMDMLPYNIRVTQVCPGAVNTEFSLVRFKGNQDRADLVYDGYDALTAENIADAVFYAVSQPPHVDIQDILVMPTAQANGSMFHKNN
ncbi:MULTISPECIES: SDR family NAD(P)-dependent oxidoreductase [unclassified Dysgonomonas]|jgi:NADP-dependent 3-hydroxy acid dehydrogenase YdfG|uniref:SDR family NAD(P)-dependent oxidoreductase n=1 Tax=unclassified Dysgonomonas TaxID=2630389 RepID=UPI0025BBF3EA|nr:MULTISPECIES: SDR family NAD(P)-dependent oxidoreductase [unclassified Dysgonomonas]MDR2004838.1 SDR family NAD(P)-dependent oxidoreductase [Prevotella sp.]HMM01455.1 SDR family NAD(P)-dependent oxidoreductase [Dysgonomonas sp.]